MNEEERLLADYSTDIVTVFTAAMKHCVEHDRDLRYLRTWSRGKSVQPNITVLGA